MMDVDFNKYTIGFIGFGLIGGSIAMALKDKYPNMRVIGYEYKHKISEENLLSEDNELGLKEGVLDRITDSLDDFSTCDIIFLCAPVIQNVGYLKSLKKIIKADCIITDVGSVKTNIHNYVKDNGLKTNFIGGHPMTGSEKSGYKNANSKLFENAYYILTTTDKTSNNHLEIMTRLVQDIFAIPIVLGFIEHDKIVAGISDLPHIVAASLVNLVKNQRNNRDLMKKLAAGGFRDITRIASSSPEVWENISIANSEFIVDLLNQYTDLLKDIVGALERKDNKYVYDTFSSAKYFRNELPEKGRGLLEKILETYVDIDDETGAIAMIATLLAGSGINIKNIGIIHNREFHDGVLRIEFYDEDSLKDAVNLLKQRNYTVYER